MLVEKVARYIERHRLLQKGDRLLVAVSGGPDSLCLLHVLRALAPRYDLSLIIAHLDHRIRPEARHEAETVRSLAASWALPFEGAAVDVPAYRSGRRVSASEASRIVRFRFLLEAAKKHGAGKIALGQQLDDQAETVLFNLLRGTGPDGLAGILPRRNYGPVELIRPLLGTSRLEIERYCLEQKLEPARDASNLKTDYTRNRIRLELIPYLEDRYNPNLRFSLAQLASLVAADRAFLGAKAQIKFSELARWNNKQLIVKRSAFNALPGALRGRIAYRALLKFVPGRSLSRRHVDQLLQLAEKPGPARVLLLPGGAQACTSYEQIILSPGRLEQGKRFSDISLQIPGCTYLPDRRIRMEAHLLGPGGLVWPPQPHQAYLDYDSLPGPLALRSRWPGARFHPQGAPGSKKLKDYFIDRKIPRHRRDDYLLVTSGSKVVWVAGERIAHPYRITGKTKNVLVLELKNSMQGRGSDGD